MSLPDLRRALEALDEPTCCEGSVPLDERLAIMLPDGDVAAADDPGFVDWLIAHGEPAPFGQGGETKLDPAVRHAVRLVARGAAQVSGFDLDAILGDIELVLVQRTHLVATLTDVIVYPVGGHFAAHKDTPQSADLVGTLVVGLPIEHTGGAFRIDDGVAPRVVDWSGAVAPDVLRWVAVLSDVDHAIERVESGARVTLVYALTLSDRVRDDSVRLERRLAELRSVARRLDVDEHPYMIGCARHVIAIDGEQPQGIDTLRGADREIADVLVECGYTVKVRTCLAARNVEDFGPAPWSQLRIDDEVSLARLARPLLDSEIAALLECVTFDQPMCDGGGFDDDETSDLTSHVLDRVSIHRWVFRRTAAASFLRAVEFADDGFVGNAAVESHLYKLAALEVTR